MKMATVKIGDKTFEVTEAPILIYVQSDITPIARFVTPTKTYEVNVKDKLKLQMT